MRCLHPGCEQRVKSRGLCQPHYAKRSKQVARGETTWPKLIAAGAACGFTPFSLRRSAMAAARP